MSLEAKFLTHRVLTQSDSQSVVAQAVSERLSQITPSDNYACLLDACIEAEEICNQ